MSCFVLRRQVKGARGIQNRFDNSNNHPRRGRYHLDSAGKHPNSAQSRPTALIIASIRPKIPQTTLTIAPIRPGCGPRSRIRTARKSRVNGFPRSERAKTNPRNIDTFGGSFPAVLSLESCGFGAKKCGCFGGPKALVHFAGNHSPSMRQHPLRRQRPTYQC